ncbi:MAG: NrfD/PsrC family molybdoenzyme membrane anchor subunit [Chloroflexota bacterium]
MSVHVAGRTLRTDPRVALRAIRREVAGMPRPLKLWFTLLGVLCLVGAVGAVIALPPGWEVLGTTPSFEWGVLITGYVFFAITTSGLCLASSLGTVFGIEMFIPLEKRHAILALLSLITAFGIIALDLHYPVRMVLGAVLSPSPLSPMWWMGVFYGVYLVFLLTEVWSMFSGHWQIHRIACTLSSITAILAPTTLGAVFGVLAARSYWHGAFTPPAMVTAALLSGVALLGIVFYPVHRFRLAGWERATTLAIPAIRLLMTIVLAVTVLVVAWQVMFGLYGVVPGLSDATGALLIGPLALGFWIVRVFLGLAVPLALVLLPRTRTPAGLFGASCLAFVGLFADRMIFVSAGQIAPGTAVAGVVSSPWTAYGPTLVEVSIIVGAFAFLALGYTLAERYLPMGEHEGHLVGAFPGSAKPAATLRDEAPDPGTPADPVTPAAPILDPAGSAL